MGCVGWRIEGFRGFVDLFFGKLMRFYVRAGSHKVC